MTACGKSLSAFHARKRLLSSSFVDFLNIFPRSEISRKSRFISSHFHRVHYSSLSSSVTACLRSNLEIPNKRLNGRTGVRFISFSTKREMRFVQFAVPTEDKIGPKRLGALLIGNDGGDDVVVDISGVDSSIPNDMVTFLNAGPEKVKKAKRIVAEGRSVLELSRLKLLPPVTRPDKVVCVGLNYKDHCEEQKAPLPPEPVFFSKWSSCITGPNDDIPYPSITKVSGATLILAVRKNFGIKECPYQKNVINTKNILEMHFHYPVKLSLHSSMKEQLSMFWHEHFQISINYMAYLLAMMNGNEYLDWEVEVALIIGKKARDVHPASAMDYVFGMCAAQDITARDWQGKGSRSRNAGQWLIAKATDSSCPLGPAVVQLSSIPDIKTMSLRCSVNGELKQDGNTHNMIHSFEEIVAFFSHCCTLLPGDVILTGTPSGVGVFRKPPEYLQIGDVIETEIEGIGKLVNKIVKG